MSKNLDHAYDEYLKSRSTEVMPLMQDYAKRLEAKNFRYGRFVIPSFYKSHFIDPKQEHMLKRASATLTQVINTATRLYFDEGHLAYVYRIPPDAADLIKIDPGYSRTVVFSRFDALLEGMSLKIIELNCDCPAGVAYSDLLEDAFLAEQPLQPFFHDHHIRRTHRMEILLNTLLEVYEEFGGYENPQIAIIDWRHSRTTSEYDHLQSFFQAKGYKTTVADPRELKYRGGKLYHKNFRVHLIYRRTPFDEILERLDELQDLIRAYRDRAVCMVNPLRSRLAGTQALLSILTNPEYNHFFTESENKIKREHIPWTRRLADAEDFYGGKKIYMIDFLKDEKETLILKPSASGSGREITIGCETPDKQWNAVIDRALKEDWVVQEFVNIPIITVPRVVNRKLDFAYKKYNFNLLTFGGKFAGGVSRLSDESVINVARGGGLIPSLLSEYVPERHDA